MKATRLCFDSSVWNALLNKEPGRDHDSIISWLKQADIGRAQLIVPAIVLSEIACNPNTAIVQMFEQVLNRSSIQQCDITFPIAKLAAEVRRKVLNDGKKLKTPDALIVACAEHHNCAVILAYDPHLLRCHGKYDLHAKICTPENSHDHPLLNSIDAEDTSA